MAGGVNSGPKLSEEENRDFLMCEHNGMPDAILYILEKMPCEKEEDK